MDGGQKTTTTGTRTSGVASWSLRAAKKMLEGMLADGEIIEVQVEGWKTLHHALASDTRTLRDLSAGRIPKAWTPLETTTTEEVRLHPASPARIVAVQATEPWRLNTAV